MNDLISRSRLMNTIATEVHYDTEKPLEMYGKLLQLIQDAPTEPQYAPTKLQFLSARDVENTFIMGYPATELLMLAEALRNQGVGTEDLRRFVNNTMYAYDFARETVINSIQKSLDRIYEERIEKNE